MTNDGYGNFSLAQRNPARTSTPRRAAHDATGDLLEVEAACLAQPTCSPRIETSSRQFYAVKNQTDTVRVQEEIAGPSAGR
jgi:hypothetical protein